MAGNITLDNLVSVSELSHGGVSKTLSRVGNNNPIVVMRNNKPAAGVISPDEYRRLTEAEEDFALYLEAEERMKKGDGTRLGMDDVFGKEYKPVDDGYVPESNDGLGHRIHRGATRRIKRSWHSRRVSAVGRTGRSDAEDGVNQDHGPSKTARSTIRPRRVGHGRSPGPWTRGQMDHVDAGGPPTCPARFRSTSCEWTNGPHAGPIMRPTRRTM